MLTLLYAKVNNMAEGIAVSAYCFQYNVKSECFDSAINIPPFSG